MESLSACARLVLFAFLDMENLVVEEVNNAG